MLRRYSSTVRLTTYNCNSRKKQMAPLAATVNDTQTFTIRQEVCAGVVDAVRLLLHDKEFMSEFWRQGYEELVNHSGRGASQWVGRRLLNWLVGGGVLAGIAWLIRYGTK